jgi:H+/Cl- antiporter ClcA
LKHTRIQSTEVQKHNRVRFVVRNGTTIIIIIIIIIITTYLCPLKTYPEFYNFTRQGLIQPRDFNCAYGMMLISLLLFKMIILMMTTMKTATIRYNEVGKLISGSHGGEYEALVLWDAAPCSLVEVYRRFVGACCLHHRPDDGGSKNV